MKLHPILAAACLWAACLHAGSHELHVDGAQIKDAQGRVVMLRGINLGGSSKLPLTRGAADDLFDHRHVSFVGRPFPLSEADAHFARLHAWGLDVVRWVVPWEAVEHAGPGQFDRDYLQYLHDAVAKARARGILVLIDSHQDAWSRWTGGDGAPGWTLEAVGIDLQQLQATGAVTAFAGPSHGGAPTDWTANYTRFGAATLFTLFFAGNDFAPGLAVDGRPVQEHLQAHYLEAMRQVALALKDLPNVIGFGTLNEPGRGFIGIASLEETPRALPSGGPSPTPYQGMLAAAGHPQTVAVRNERGDAIAQAVLNPKARSLWRPGVEPVWKQQGVWTDAGGRPRLLQPRYFAERNGRRVDFAADYLMPFIRRYADTIHSVMPDALIAIDPVAVLGDETSQPLLAGPAIAGAVAAPKWYDGPTLGTQMFYPWLDDAGREGVKRRFTDDVAGVLAASRLRMKDMPVLIGEFGLPMQLNGKRAYADGDYRQHASVMDSYFRAMEDNLANALLWNYTPDNSHAQGDRWNGEDLSIYSADDRHADDSRAVPAVVRPYAARTAGQPLRMHFDLKTRTFEFEFRPDAAARAPTEVFVPRLHYPGGYAATVTGGHVEQGAAQDRLLVKADPDAATVRLHLEPRP